MNKSFIVFILFGFSVICALYSCSPNAESMSVVQRHPFRMEIMREDGLQVTWEGYTDGYEPGISEHTRVAIQNNSNLRWVGRICSLLFIPNSSGKMLHLGRRKFSLTPGEGLDETIKFGLPSNFPPGTYGLTLVVQRPTGPTVNVTPIQIGKTGQAWYDDPWFSEASLDACQ